MTADAPATGRLAGKVAMVLGAGSSAPGWSIGRAVATRFAREGARVMAVDIDPASLAETREIIRAEGGTCEIEVADATVLSDLQRAVAACLGSFGRLDVLHNNVGRGGPGGVESTSDADWRRSLELNLTSAFLACKAAVPAMLKQGGGAFVHVSSVAGIRYSGTPTIAYQAAKAGLIQMSRGVALEYASRGIRSNCVLPGYVDTPEILRRLGARFGTDQLPGVLAKRASKVPQGRTASPWEIAAAALFLASDESAHITGTELIVDGGKSAQCAEPYMPS